MEKLTGIQIIEILKEKIEEVSSFAYDEIPYTIIEEDEKIQTIKDLWLVENPNPGYNHPTYQEWFNKYQNIPSKYDSAKKRWMQENNIQINSSLKLNLVFHIEHHRIYKDFLKFKSSISLCVKFVVFILNFE